MTKIQDIFEILVEKYKSLQLGKKGPLRKDHARSFFTIEQQTMLPTLTEDPASWNGSSLLSVTQITRSGLELLFRVSQEMRDLVRSQGGDNRLQHAVLGTVFYEASTRTSCSFQAAMLRLGGKNIHVDGKGNTSAGKKGETLEDTIRCLECYTNVTVLRHPTQGSVGRVIENATKPVLNAGDGTGEHPTQALLDVFTIYDELVLLSSQQQQKIPLVVVLLGDLKHGRTVHSLAKLLANSGVWDRKLTLRYCAPNGLEMPHSVRDFVSKFENVQQETYTDLHLASVDAHVLYVTRVQRERFGSDEAYEKVKVRSTCLTVLLVLSPRLKNPIMYDDRGPTSWTKPLWRLPQQT